MWTGFQIRNDFVKRLVQYVFVEKSLNDGLLFGGEKFKPRQKVLKGLGIHNGLISEDMPSVYAFQHLTGT
jgi:hypothetical protein